MDTGFQSRRRFLQTGLVLTGLGLLAGCRGLPWPGAQTIRIRRIGYLASYPLPSPPSLHLNVVAFLRGLRELGWIDGQNVAIDYRSAEFRDERLPELAAELVNVDVDVIVATATPGALAAKQVTATVPIVIPVMLDPVGSGLVESLAHPGGNVTGLSFYGPVLSGKRLQLLKEVMPAVARVAVLWNATNRASASDFRQTEVAAASLGIQVQSQELHSPDDFEGAFAAIGGQRPDALVVLPDNLTGFYRQRIVDFTAVTQLPGLYPQKIYAAAGGLMAYGPDSDEPFIRAAAYVDKIFKGAKPANLPVEQPTRLDFVINLKTAQALGITIPQSVLEQASEVIQ